MGTGSVTTSHPRMPDIFYHFVFRDVVHTSIPNLLSVDFIKRLSLDLPVMMQACGREATPQPSQVPL